MQLEVGAFNSRLFATIVENETVAGRIPLKKKVNSLAKVDENALTK